MVSDLQRNMNQLLEEFLQGGFWSGYRWPARPVDRAFPLTNVWESPTAYVIQAELAGFDEANLDISLKDNVLVIRGEYPDANVHQGGVLLVQEFARGVFRREIRLPKDVAPDEVQAEFRNGLLTITLPLRAGDQHTSRKIPIG
jgi:HSP20 family protein